MGNYQLTLVGGGVRSGKSAHAVSLALQAGPKRTFIATAQAFDDEMERRIAAHQAERGQDFRTLEAPLDLFSALAQCTDQDAILIDCMTLWLSNQLLQAREPASILSVLDEVLEQIRTLPGEVIVVSNEVGMGIVPESRLGRQFRDLAGHANQRLARAAQRVHFAAMGLILQLHPAPLALVTPVTPTC